MFGISKRSAWQTNILYCSASHRSDQSAFGLPRMFGNQRWFGLLPSTSGLDYRSAYSSHTMKKSFGMERRVWPLTVRPVRFGAQGMPYLDRVIQLPGPLEKSNPPSSINRGARVQKKGSNSREYWGDSAIFKTHSRLISFTLQVYSSN